VTTFGFRAARADGEIVRGQVEAPTSLAALEQVAGRGLLALSIAESTEPRRLRAVAGPVELAAVFSGLSAMLDAGLPVDRALAAVRESSSPALAGALEDASLLVREGRSLSAALAASRVATPLVLGLIRAGEQGGSLAAACAIAADELERDAETRARIRAALTYPVFLAIAGSISIAVIAGFVVPRFAELLADQRQALPLSTQLLLAVSGALGRLAVPVAALLATVAVSLVYWARTPAGLTAVHRFLLGLPVIGPLRFRFASARVCGSLAGLLEAGVPLLPGLDLAADAGGDRVIGARLAAARTDVESGEKLAAALRRRQALTPPALRLVAFGEQAGRLASFLRHAARLEAGTAHRAVQRAVTLIEPLLILAFGAVVALVALALLQAVYSVRPAAF